ncbi:MAG: c-type cytochrome [Verrucomicrobiales bacterium]
MTRIFPTATRGAPSVLVRYVCVAWGFSLPAATATPEPHDPTVPWQEQVRNALSVWEHAQGTESKMAALDDLEPLAAARPLILAPLRPALTAAEAPVRARLFTLMSQVGFQDIVGEARQALLDPDPTVVIAAAEVMGRLAPVSVRDDLLSVWESTTPPVPTVAEAVTAALARSVAAPNLAALQASEKPAVRQAALAALQLQASPRCADFLNDRMAHIAESAAKSLYEDRLESAWPKLMAAGWCTPSPLPSGAQRYAIAAAWHGGGEAEAQAMASWLASQPPADRGPPVDGAIHLAWHALLHWDTPPENDPMDPGRPFGARPRPAAEAWRAIEQQASALGPRALALGESELAHWRRLRARMTSAPRPTAQFLEFLNDSSRPDGERLFHFQSRLAATTDAAAQSAMATAALMVESAPRLRSAARAWLFARRGPGAVAWILESLAAATAIEKQAAMQLIGQSESPETLPYLRRLLDQARLGLVDPAVMPELVEAADRRARADGPDARSLRASLDAWRTAQSPSLGDPLRPWRPALQPGDAEKGRALFFSETTQCAHCHRWSARQATAAPPLQAVSQRLEGPALLEALVLPKHPQPAPDTPAIGCRPMGTLLTLCELRDLMSFLQSQP